MQTEPAPVRVTVRTRFSDFYELQSRFLLRRMWFLPGLFMVALYAAPIHGAVAVLTGLIVGCSMIFVSPIVQWRSRKKRDANFVAPTIYTFSESGVSMEWPTATVDFKWSAFKKFSVTGKYVLMHMPSGVFYIPKREVSEAEWAGIRRWVEGHGARR
jgi:YcxB-like protein